MLGRRFPTTPPEVLAVGMITQSQNDGWDVMERLANDDYNYKGMDDDATGYPAVRGARTPYSYPAVPGTYTYWMGSNNAADFTVDDKAWEPLVIGTNNGFHDGAAFNGVGPELTLCTDLHEATGKTILLFKMCFPGTGISSMATPGTPGNWNNTNRQIWMDYCIARGLRDWRAANPTHRVRYIGTCAWPGGRDAIDGISTATFKTQLGLLKTYVDNSIGSLFVTPTSKLPIWNYADVNFFPEGHPTYANQTAINLGTTQFVAENARCYLVNTAAYPKCNTQTAEEAAPIAVNTSGLNSAGRQDDNHPTRICMDIVGSKWAKNFIAAGVA